MFIFKQKNRGKKMTVLGLVVCLILNSVGAVFAENLDLEINDRTTAENLYFQIDGRKNPQDLYLSIYNTLNQNMGAKAVQRVSEQNGFSTEDVQSVLSGNFTPELKTRCREWFPSETNASFYECLNLVKENYEYEKHLITFENNLRSEAEASEIWSDGDLSNSFFDLMVDLNIIEIILFGENSYEYPYDLNLYKSVTEKERDEETESENAPITETEETETGEDGVGAEIDETASNEFCRDPEEILFTQKIWQADDSGEDLTESISKQSFSLRQTNSRGGDFQAPKTNSDCGDSSSPFYVEGGVSLYHGLLCTDPWPCDSVFCIKISEVLQDIGSDDTASSDPKSQSIQGLVTKGIRQLNNLKAHTLTVKENSNERFFPSVGKFFKQKLGLDVIVQNLPLQFTPEAKGTSFDQDTDLVESLYTVICQETGTFCQKNNDIVSKEATRTLNRQTEDGDLQTTTWEKLTVNDETLRKKYKDIKQAWQYSEKVKNRQNFWEEFKKHLNLTALYFDAMQQIFFKLDQKGMEILQESGQGCNS